MLLLLGNLSEGLVVGSEQSKDDVESSCARLAGLEVVFDGLDRISNEFHGVADLKGLGDEISVAADKAVQDVGDFTDSRGDVFSLGVDHGLLYDSFVCDIISALRPEITRADMICCKAKEREREV